MLCPFLTYFSHRYPVVRNKVIEIQINLKGIRCLNFSEAYVEAKVGDTVRKKVLAVPETAEKIGQAVCKHSQVINGTSKVSGLQRGTPGRPIRRN